MITVVPKGLLPDNSQITIKNNLDLAAKFVSEKMVQRQNDIEWSKITQQSPAGAFSGQSLQHLASLLLGVGGMRSAARGHDHADQTEHKACNRIDQSDTCKNCKNRVMNHEDACSRCGSTKIKRNNDSKFLLTMNSESELQNYIVGPRLALTLLEYPNRLDPNTISLKMWEIWPKASPGFRALCEDYFEKVVRESKRRGRKYAPKNFWPYSFQFYKSRPILICSMKITNALTTKPHINIEHYIEPDADRSQYSPEPMPICKLEPCEIDTLRVNYGISLFDGWDIMSKEDKRKAISASIDVLNKEYLDFIPLRDLNISDQNTAYVR